MRLKCGNEVISCVRWKSSDENNFIQIWAFSNQKSHFLGAEPGCHSPQSISSCIERSVMGVQQKLDRKSIWSNNKQKQQNKFFF